MNNNKMIQKGAVENNVTQHGGVSSADRWRPN